ncbi:hypothetical protein DH2020_037590 [Rehmannia glutinosa]|uniref:Protein kinase domain-containing protein n=1 Tax=Rehmannia glutinosa TaxID=99300 RepID=A0ABR0V2G1_REHGL
MIFLFHQIIIPSLISVLALSSFAQNINSTLCNQVCGENRVQYPFGFSDGCKIRLSCSGDSGKIGIGDFDVHNVTSDQILINLPAKCNRSIGDLSRLFGANFAPTWRNGILLENCTAPSNDCVVPSRLLSSRIGFENCNPELGITDRRNISCYSVGIDDVSEFLDYGKVGGKGNCSVLFSSIMVDLNDNVTSATESSSIALDFQTVELGWWLDGNCDCDPNANCTPVAYGRQLGFRFSDCSAGWYISGRCGNKVGILVGGIMAGASLVAALAVICYCIKKRTSTLKSRLSAASDKRSIGNTSVPFYPYKEIERASNGFSEKQRLGTGAYGTVYAGKLHNDEWVAIKKIRYRDHDSVEQVMNEIASFLRQSSEFGPPFRMLH